MRAVLLATSPGAEAHLPPPLHGRPGETVTGRLRRQLAGFGVTDVTVIGRPEIMPGLPVDPESTPGRVTVRTATNPAGDLRLLAEAVTGDEPVLLLTADALLADTAISAVLSDPTERSGVLVGPLEDARPGEPPLRRDRGLVLSVGTGFHRAAGADAAGCGVLKITEPFLPELRAAVAQLLADDITELTGETDAWTLVLLAVVRGGTKLTAYSVPGVPYGRVDSQSAAESLHEDITRCDEDAVRMRLCVKADDDLFATYSISSYSRHLVRFFRRVRLTPVAVTWLSIFLAFGAAALFVQASRPALIGGALLMYVSFALDCVDGQLARYTHRFTAFGGWLDMIADRAKEYLIYGGLAWGAAASGHDWAWPLAIAALSVQVVRHMTDTWYGTMQDAATLRQATRSLLYAEDGFATTGGGETAPGSAAVRLGRTLGRLSARFTAQRRSPAYWFKRTIVFPVGERWLVMGLGAALFNGEVALAALLAWQLVAFAYTLAGRTLRAWSAKVAVLARPDKAVHRDDGPLSRLLPALTVPPLPVLAVAVAGIGVAIVLAATGAGAARWVTVVAGIVLLAAVTTAGNRHAGPLDWLVPAGLRAGEYGLAVACGLVGGVPLPLVFGLLTAFALYHYDLAARVDKAASPMGSREFGLGWEGRALLLLVALIPGVATWLFALLTAHMVLVFLGGALLGRRRAARRPGSPERVATAA
ncbi:CDP-alcohol phosphatidyltransferase-like enzyme [Stackebrandtia albiflava]|uniref:CDP-alcohol phosphatidyltransferase-like enzyme n=1 Tax=Stackebrandtia albiflava TaxID=406432 RepID=A0A562V340_9ACTN|nr:DUF5941 domain-containing protein [Stackebrandtia albiflava]TWJ12319.1 CDP-alcohol phosphatidyltransferase-like enzyme [Stackebrandtia albiflava]